MSKGDKARPPQISREEEDLNWALALGHITFARWKKKRAKLEAEGKIYRQPRYKLNTSTED